MPTIKSVSPTDFDDENDDDILPDAAISRRRSRSFVTSGDRLQKIVENVEINPTSSSEDIDTNLPPSSFRPVDEPQSPQRLGTPAVGFHYRSQSSPALTPLQLPPVPKAPTPRPPELASPDKSRSEHVHIGSRFRRLANLKSDSKPSGDIP